jgi:hypothetical protein
MMNAKKLAFLKFMQIKEQNSHYFSEFQSHIPHYILSSQLIMVNVTPFIGINSKICLTVGGFLNCLLIWLVIKKTSPVMKSYSKIVLQTCLCDLANLIIGDIEQPVRSC